ncbi:hypothetical protein TVAG_476580 [Trichomonas vaginalis G3]|uniref:GyrI-like small molecule binding domain-containing protein n=1 Tax=Trichomonas vaginalis (strain ATCC PRA-98 / G3) TaxID=412133 RepID=A2DA81_TRIV3|nr:Gyrl-like family protein [Trichomonas vaginalis G3]EAY22729.1 hypothetical protein TVAG_476580 [Trichomonas vaginalis G3]KAI5525540.1 Gyrl-like family protein [Trichomonas vaginalis G3]|eukprot:XP_001583715.1 hypothetical protein [Trichomonas vaginalis G3]
MSTFFVLAIVGVIVVIALLLVKFHLFTTPVVKEEYISKFKVVYTTFVGPYSQAYKMYAVVESALSKANDGKDFSKVPCFGIYYDKPKSVPDEKLRSVVGKIVEDNVEIPNSDDGSIKSEEIELGDVVVSHFPFQSFVDIFVGISKCYPALNKYTEEHKEIQLAGPMVELYGYVPENISYIAPKGKRTGILQDFPVKN